MTVYLDIIFLENVCMNYIIIYATALLIKSTIKPIRVFLASVIGAFYAIISVMKIFDIFSSVIVKILVSIFIVYVAIDAKNFKNLFKGLLVFYLVSFMFGGISLALLYFIKPENILMKNGIYIGTYPIKIVLLGGVLGHILISVVYSIIKSKFSKRKKVCDIEICINGKTRMLKALIDSGNFLKEPITGTPVLVVETVFLFSLVPKIILDNIDNIILGNFDILNIENDNEDVKAFINKFRVIPFNSLGKENGLLLGIKFDYIKILKSEDLDNKKIEDIIIALYDKKLSKERRI